MKKGKTWRVYLLTILAVALIAGACDLNNPWIDDWWVGPEVFRSVTPIKYFTITFKSNCGTGTGGDYIDLVNDPNNDNEDANGDPAYIDPPVQKILVGTNVNEPGLVENTGRFILGWYTDDDNDGTITATDTKWDFTKPPRSDMTLYPRWESSGYTINFNLNAGSTGITGADTTYHSTNNNTGLPRPEYIAVDGMDIGKLSIPKWFGIDSDASSPASNYVFTGWYKEDTCTTKWDFNESPTETDDGLDGNNSNDTITLYAGWELKTGVTINKVEFDTGGASSTLPTLEIPQGQTIPVPDGITKKNYVFDGWYTDSSFSTKYDFSTPPAGNIKLYAKWTPEPYTPPWYDDNYDGLYNIKGSGKEYIPFQVTPDGYDLSDWDDTNGDSDGGATNKANYDNLLLVIEQLKKRPDAIAQIIGYKNSTSDNLDTQRELQTWWLLWQETGINPKQLVINTALPPGYSGNPPLSNDMIIAPNASEGVVGQDGDEIKVYIYLP